jgi:hypothetical protein
LPLVVKVIGIVEGPVDGIEDGCGGNIKNGSSLLVSSSTSTKGLELAWKREPVKAILMARSFEKKLGLVKGRSGDGFEDSCSDSIGDGLSHGAKLDIDEGSKDRFEDDALLGVKLGINRGRGFIEMASKMGEELASKMDLFLLVARLTKVLKRALVSCSALMKGR